MQRRSRVCRQKEVGAAEGQGIAASAIAVLTAANNSITLGDAVRARVEAKATSVGAAQMHRADAVRTQRRDAAHRSTRGGREVNEMGAALRPCLQALGFRTQPFCTTQVPCGA